MTSTPMTLDALRQSLLSGATAQGSVNELDLQRERANALRDTPLAQGGKRSGYVSPFMIAANTAQRLSGEREGRRLGKERQGLSQAVAQAKTDSTMYGLETDAANTAEQNRQWQSTYDTGVEQFGLKQAAEDRRAREAAARANSTSALAGKKFEYQKARDILTDKLAANERSWERGEVDNVEAWQINGDPTNVKVFKQVGGRDYVDAITGEPADFTNRVPYSKPTGPLVEVNTGGAQDEYSDSQKGDLAGLASGMNIAEMVARRANALPDDEVAEMNAVGPRLKHILLNSLGSFSTIASDELSDFSDEAKAYYEALAAMDAEERKRIFGTAVSGHEEMSSRQFLAAVMGLSFDTQLSRLSNYYANNREKALSLGDTLGAQRVQNTFDAMNKRHGEDRVLGEGGLGFTVRRPPETVKLPLKNDKGWVLMTDKNGLRAYVGPNPEDVEEVE